ncbi:hypothetical protein POVCU2_0073710 [Plasmodium ovale curtisi]|uniref:Uncharacterized protein n=1 Tax=Plasmodium ovale curtisi TaxID=864141 RepID=A0A1A8WHC0_PLAOA|nr:hypothetical protein POVCU2_0073710 [Plasmodium ovale curtisi]SBT02518.1 hypothetical protein POVCU1_077820 [Plasmodium ovale curtisi]
MPFLRLSSYEMCKMFGNVLQNFEVLNTSYFEYTLREKRGTSERGTTFYVPAKKGNITLDRVSPVHALEHFLTNRPHTLT